MMAGFANGNAYCFLFMFIACLYVGFRNIYEGRWEFLKVIGGKISAP